MRVEKRYNFQEQTINLFGRQEADRQLEIQVHVFSTSQKLFNLICRDHRVFYYMIRCEGFSKVSHVRVTLEKNKVKTCKKHVLPLDISYNSHIYLIYRYLGSYLKLWL